MTTTINSVQVEFHLNPPLVTYLQGADMTISALQDTFRQIEESDEGRLQPYLKIISASGNENFSSDGSVTNALTITVLSPYEQAFQSGAIPFQSSAGNLLGTFVDSPGAIVQINNAVGALNLSSADIEFASFGGGVHINTITGVPLSSGVDGKLADGALIGSARAPVDNIPDANTIATTRGFDVFFFDSSITLDTGDSIVNKTVIGQSPVLTIVTINPASIITNSQFRSCNMSGTLDGGSLIIGCHTTTIAFFNGAIHDTLLEAGTLTLGGGVDAHILNCWDGVPGSGTPIIDFGGSGQGLSLANYAGDITLQNKSGSEPCSVDLNTGTVTITDTVTVGDIILRGIGRWVNKLTYAGGANVIDELVDGILIQELESIPLIEAAVAGNATIAPDNLSVTINDDTGSPIRVLDVSADGRDRTIQ